METLLDLGGVSVDVIRKDIKNLHLSVHPPTGRARIAAPERASLETIRAFAIAHLAWIRRHQRKITMQEREPPREYVNRESHFVWGERVMLQMIELDATPSVTRKHRTLTLQVRPGATGGDRVGTCTFCGSGPTEAVVGCPDEGAPILWQVAVCGECLADTIMWRFAEVKAERVST
jgi:hypothetical protein